MESSNPDIPGLGFKEIVGRLREAHQGFYERAVRDKWVFAIPVVPPRGDITLTFLECHVFIPTEDAHQYNTLNGWTLKLEDSVMHTGNGYPVKVESQVVYTETHYDEHYNAMRIIRLSKPLLQTQSTPHSSASRLGKRVHLSAEDESELEMRLSHIQWGTDTIAERDFLLSFKGTEPVWRRFQKSLTSCRETFESAWRADNIERYNHLLDTAMSWVGQKVWTLSTTTADDFLAVESLKYFLVQHAVMKTDLVLSIECLIMDEIYDITMSALVRLHRDSDSKLKAVINLMPPEGPEAVLGLPQRIHSSPKSAVKCMRKITEERVPYGKLMCLKAVFQAIMDSTDPNDDADDVHSDGVVHREGDHDDDYTHAHEDDDAHEQQQGQQVTDDSAVVDVPTKLRRVRSSPSCTLTADDLLPLLMSTILQSRVPSLCAHLSYIQFRQEHTSELGYYLTTVRAALEYLRNDLLPFMQQRTAQQQPDDPTMSPLSQSIPIEASQGTTSLARGRHNDEDESASISPIVHAAAGDANSPGEIGSPSGATSSLRGRPLGRMTPTPSKLSFTDDEEDDVDEGTTKRHISSAGVAVTPAVDPAAWAAAANAVSRASPPSDSPGLIRLNERRRMSARRGRSAEYWDVKSAPPLGDASSSDGVIATSRHTFPSIGSRDAPQHGTSNPQQPQHRLWMNVTTSSPSSPSSSSPSSVVKAVRAFNVSSSMFGDTQARRGDVKWSEMDEILYRMSDPRTGVELRDRTYMFKHYCSCFVASEAISWMLQHFDRLLSVRQCIGVGNDLLALGYIQHVTGKPKPFSNSYLFYEFIKRPTIVPIRQRNAILATYARMVMEVDSSTRQHLFKSYPDCFIGSEAVDWIVAKTVIRTRANAVALMRRMQTMGLVHRFGEADMLFHDDANYYIFADIRPFPNCYQHFSGSKAASPPAGDGSARNGSNARVAQRQHVVASGGSSGDSDGRDAYRHNGDDSDGSDDSFGHDVGRRLSRTSFSAQAVGGMQSVSPAEVGRIVVFGDDQDDVSGGDGDGDGDKVASNPHQQQQGVDGESDWVIVSGKTPEQGGEEGNSVLLHCDDIGTQGTQPGKGTESTLPLDSFVVLDGGSGGREVGGGCAQVEDEGEAQRDGSNACVLAGVAMGEAVSHDTSIQSDQRVPL